MDARSEGVPGFWRFAAAHPDRLAAVDVDGATVTFGELGHRVDRTSHWLRSRGIGPRAPLAVVARNSLSYLGVVLAASQVGTRYTLVNSHLTAPEVRFVLDDCGAALVVTDAASAAVVGEAGGTRDVVSLSPPGSLAAPTMRSWDDLLGPQPDGAPADRTAGAIMLYTSGTSGRPKGVRSTLAPVSPEAAAERATFALTRFGIDPAAHVGDGTHLVTSPLYHAAPITNATLALHLGHTVVVMPRFDAAGSLELIGRHGVTWTHVVPTMMKRWLDLDDDVRARADLTTMRWLIHAAAPCPPAVKRRIIEWFGPIVEEYYSSTEAGGTSIGAEDWLRHPGSVGRPWPGADVKVLDEDGAPLPPGSVGQIYLRNLRPFEYHNDPAKTDETRRGDYVTVGDLGSLDADGYLYLADRRTDLIISGGVNVYPAEVEAVLMAHPAVADAAVIGVPDADLGELVRAVVEARPDPAPDLVADLTAHCAVHLAEFKRPRQIELRGSLPRSEAGKLLRRVLRDEHREHREPTPGGTP
jgi:long-chain acyl-CoA synthetase